jgi:hypothetical protein
MLGGFVSLQKIDIAAAVIASVMVAALAVFFQKTRIGRALRAVADSHKAALSVGISLEQIWVTVWFAAGIVALATGIMWGARSDVSFALQTLALKALPVLILGGFTSVPGAIVGGPSSGSARSREFYWGPLLGSASKAGSPTSLRSCSCCFGRRDFSARRLSSASEGTPCSIAKRASSRPLTPPTSRFFRSVRIASASRSSCSSPSSSCRCWRRASC